MMLVFPKSNAISSDTEPVMTEDRIAACLRAACMARDHGRILMALARTGTYRRFSQSDNIGKEAYARAYSYLRMAKDIKRSAT